MSEKRVTVSLVQITQDTRDAGTMVREETYFCLPGADYSQTCAAILAAQVEWVNTVQEAFDAKLAEGRNELPRVHQHRGPAICDPRRCLPLPGWPERGRFRGLGSWGAADQSQGRASTWPVGRLAVSRGPGTEDGVHVDEAAMDVTAEDVIERGGIVQTLRGGTPKSATVADLPDSNLGRDLAEAEAEIADTKQAYYDALSRRNRALRALAREGGDE